MEKLGAYVTWQQVPGKFTDNMQHAREGTERPGEKLPFLPKELTEQEHYVRVGSLQYLGAREVSTSDCKAVKERLLHMNGNPHTTTAVG